MADLLKDNNCLGCEHYESDANDHYYQWCLHPDAGDNLEENDNPYADITEFVAKCPITNKSPYGIT